ncbi:MAG: sigma-E processing peptidase SpoIIGA [Clostridia bacterium]|nr:sigma-E processing peptidase SpoIIGA [Clostridia bacterium]
MEIIIEYVILDNYVMNYLIIRMIESTIGRKIQSIRKHLLCVFGVIFAILLPFLSNYNFLMITYKVLVSVILVLFLKKYKSIKDYILYYFLFVTYTFLLGGGCLAIIYFLNIEYTASSIILYSLDFPLGGFVLLLGLLVKLLFVSIKIIKNKFKTSCYKYEVLLNDDGWSCKCTALFDSGNGVMCDGQCVSIMSIGLFMKLYKQVDITKFLLQKENLDFLRGVKYVDISSVGETKKHLSFVIEKMYVSGQCFENARVALVMKNFDEFDLILHRDLIIKEAV